jgi:GMP synthase (glutamine-hydrolysing)
MTTPKHDTIIILDYGSQYSRLIARRVREAKVYCEIYPWSAAAELVMGHQPKGIILSGGPHSVYAKDAPTLPSFVLDSGLPVLGICYGMQLLCHSLGGKVALSERREYGPAHLRVDDLQNQLFRNWVQSGQTDGSQKSQPADQVWMSHGDKVEIIPSSFTAIAHSDNSPLAAASDAERGYYMVQFHPEAAHTIQGGLIIANFITLICGCKADWTSENFIEEEISRLQEQIGNERIVLGLSGGLDSAVVATLIHRAVGKRLSCIFVDHGLLRQGEAEQVVGTFQREQGMHLVAINAVEDFMEALAGVLDPEEKRRVIGQLFIRIFEREAKKLGNIKLLAQGTIYPDVIESAGRDQGVAQTIKTHHNVGGLPENMRFELVEPLRTLFKDEVRRVAEALNLPPEIVWRQPFPGPGLAIRCLGEVTWERLESLRAADAIFVEELADGDMLRHDTQQAFAVLLPVRTVGVMGDGRTYQEVVALRAVTTDDFMTADWARLPAELLAHVSRRIVNEVAGVNRVVYDITSKPPGTIEWE